jgi:hypothetical protein
VITIPDRHRSITRIKLASGKGMETAEKAQFFTAFYEENFRSFWIGVVTKENYRGGVFGY